MAQEYKKTILLPIYHGMRAKNFLLTDTYRELAKDTAIRLVIVAPSFKIDYYRRAFPEADVVFAPLDISPNDEPLFGKLLAELAFNSLDTNTIRFKQLLQYWQYGNLPRFFLKRTLNYIFGSFTSSRSVIRFLDRFVAPHAAVLRIFDQYNPDLALAPDIVFPIDRFFLRAARKRGIPTAGMMRSWDNITAKGVVQILPDMLILHTTRMKRLAEKLVGMPAEKIMVSGPPDFDDYYKPAIFSREEFCQKLGIPASRRIVLFTPFFDASIDSAIILLQELLKALDDGRIPYDVQILLRYRPGYTAASSLAIPSHPRLVITYPCEQYFYGKKGAKERIIDWEFSKQDVDLLTHSMRYSEVMVNTVSTLTIDSAACDKPAIGVRFDAAPNCPPEHQITKVMDLHDHYRELERTGGIRLAKNIDELIGSINFYLKHPEADRDGRKRICEEQIEFFDGKNGTRAAEFIKSAIRPAH
ncbi:MAG: hypothetical protein HYT37_00910 [Candidatus Sungbacteria bacterium]|nr:hypothetical protein [Candidatus Sungbacteria bacterium]